MCLDQSALYLSLTHEQLMILLVLSHKGEEVTSTEAVLNNRSITAVSDIEL